MIIGNGLLGSAFKKDGFGSLADLTIFASGVSYSGEVRKEEYQRELDLLSQVMMCDTYIVYFSTCSVFDSSLSSSLYVKHKIEIENSLLERGRSLIVRLPQVVGAGGNKDNLINYLIFKILNGENFDLWSNASRSLIDVDDVVFFTKKCIDYFSPRCAQINLAAPGRISILEIVKIIEECVGKKADYNILEKGSDYAIDINQISKIFDEYFIKFHPDYFHKLIWKYCDTCVGGIL